MPGCNICQFDKVYEPPKPKQFLPGWWTPIMLPNQPAECRKCGTAKIFKWLGIHWFGYPKPLRKRGSNWAGCGCIVVLKREWEYLKWWWAYSYGRLA